MGTGDDVAARFGSPREGGSKSREERLPRKLVGARTEVVDSECNEQFCDSNLPEPITYRPSQREMPFVQPSPAKLTKLDPSAERIIRKHFVDKLLVDISLIQPHLGRTTSANYALRLFNTLRQVRDTEGGDPFIAVLMAFHDALAYKDQWASFSVQHYESARRILAKYANQDILPEKAEKAIMELEIAGFDTTPIVIQEDETE